MRITVFIILVLSINGSLSAQKYKATSDEIYSLMQYTSTKSYMTTMDSPEWDTTTTYAEFFDARANQKFNKGIACFKLFVNPTWGKDRHWVVCNCHAIDSSRYILFKNYWDNFNKRHR